MNDDQEAQRRTALGELQRHLQEDIRTATAIAAAAGVSQPTVSRLRNGTVKRLRWSKPFNKLCSMYGVPLVPETTRVPDYHALLHTAVLAAWDGTPTTGKRLLALIEAVGSLVKQSTRNTGRSYGRT